MVTAAYDIDEDQSSFQSTIFKHKNDASNTFAIENNILKHVLSTLPKTGRRPIRLETHIKKICSDDKIAKDISTLIQKSSMELVMKGFLLLHSDEGQFVDHVSNKPLANSWARFQAAQPGCRKVATSLGVNIKLDAFSLAVLINLDGTNDIGAIIGKIVDLIKSGQLSININTKEAISM